MKTKFTLEDLETLKYAEYQKKFAKELKRLPAD